MSTPAHIAVIEDDESVRSALANLLSALGHACDAYGSAEAFLAAHTADDVACIIADVHMPGMGGLDLLEHLSRQEGAVPCILITAYPQDVGRSRALRHGALAYLAKPLQQEALIACLKQAVAPR